MTTYRFLLFGIIVNRKPVHGELLLPVWLKFASHSPAMAEFGRTAGVGSAAGLNGSAPQPPPYDLNPPPYSAASPPYPSVHQRAEKHASTGYQNNYPAAMPYSPYPAYPAVPQVSYAPPQYPGYQKSPVIYVPQSTGVAALPTLPSIVYQQHPSSICVVNPQNHATTYVVNQQQLGSTYVVNQQHPSAPMVLIQPGNAARGNHIIYGNPRAMGKQVTIQTGGNGVIIYK
ncbi:uncharacterized protein [Scyliorhinus torazame]|uniref:uncharacterized protein isoform X2 n=1 Tax=Scyliorhinus torazame TaxID=75743 RepID=UPI003B5CF207